MAVTVSVVVDALNEVRIAVPPYQLDSAADQDPADPVGRACINHTDSFWREPWFGQTENVSVGRAELGAPLSMCTMKNTTRQKAGKMKAEQARRTCSIVWHRVSNSLSSDSFFIWRSARSLVSRLILIFGHSGCSGVLTASVRVLCWSQYEPVHHVGVYSIIIYSIYHSGSLQ